MISGIYKIANLVTNDIYIGSSKDMNRRFIRHKSDLKNNRHGNRYLQRAYNKYGNKNFVFEVLEIVQNSNFLMNKEQYYIDNLLPKYNLCKIAAVPGSYPRTEEHREKISKALKGRKGKPHTRQTKKKLSEHFKGIPLSKEHIKNRTEAQAKVFKIISPEGDLVEGKNLHKFCKDNNLDSSSLRKVMLGKSGYKSYKGYTQYKEFK